MTAPVNNFRYSRCKFLQCDGITAVRWFDKRDVFAMSTLHGNEMLSITTKASTEPINKPKLIADYNSNMSGVDLCDQLLVCYALNRKTTKWWKRLFFSFARSQCHQCNDFVHTCIPRESSGKTVP